MAVAGGGGAGLGLASGPYDDDRWILFTRTAEGQNLSAQDKRGALSSVILYFFTELQWIPAFFYDLVIKIQSLPSTFPWLRAMTSIGLVRIESVWC